MASPKNDDDDHGDESGLILRKTSKKVITPVGCECDKRIFLKRVKSDSNHLDQNY